MPPSSSFAITKQEYQTLVQESLSFKDMPAYLQASILSAQGKEMEKYIKMFQYEKAAFTQAFQTIQQKNDQLIINCKTAISHDQQAKLSLTENCDKQEEISAAEQLLNNI